MEGIHVVEIEANFVLECPYEPKVEPTIVVNPYNYWNLDFEFLLIIIKHKHSASFELGFEN